MTRFFCSELWPVCQTGNAEETDAKTREFLRAVVEILLDHITVQNDRTTKILDFHSPDQLKEVIDFAIPDEPLNLDQLLVDCKDTLKYQVKTGININQILQLEIVPLLHKQVISFYLCYTNRSYLSIRNQRIISLASLLITERR